LPLNRAKSGKIGHFQTLNLCTSNILVIGCLNGQDVVGSYQKVEEKIPGTKITQNYWL